MKWSRKRIILIILVVLILDAGFALSGGYRVDLRKNPTSIFTNIHISVSQSDNTIDIGFHQNLPNFGVVPKRISIKVSISTPSGDISSKRVEFIYTLWFKHYYHFVTSITNGQINFLQNNEFNLKFVFGPYDLFLATTLIITNQHLG